jgi:hypothetical protein
MLTHSFEESLVLAVDSAAADFEPDSYLVREDSYEDYINYYIFPLID